MDHHWAHSSEKVLWEEGQEGWPVVRMQERDHCWTVVKASYASHDQDGDLKRTQSATGLVTLHMYKT